MTKILVVRRNDDFSRRLTKSGLSVTNCPVVRTEPLEDLSRLRDAISRTDDFDGVFITSAAAAEIFAASVREGGYGARIFVLGRRGFDILKDAVTDVVFYDFVGSAEQLVDAIGIEQLRAKRFLFVRGERSMRAIPDKLAGIADVEEVVVYRTVNVPVAEVEKQGIREKAADRQFAMACFFSPSGVESFVGQFGPGILDLTTLAAIGETTAGALRTYHKKVSVIARRPDEFADAVIEYCKPTAKGV